MVKVSKCYSESLHLWRQRLTLLCSNFKWPWQILGTIWTVATVCFLSGKLRTISPIFRGTNFTTFEHNNVDRCMRRWKLSEHNFENFTRKGCFLKTQKLLTKFPGLATSGRHNSAMITDRRKFTSKLSLYGMSICRCSIFTVTINSKSFPWSVRLLWTIE